MSVTKPAPPLGRLAAAAVALEILLGVGAVGGGIALMAGPNGEIWLVVEIAIVGYANDPPLQTLYLGLGVAITVVGVSWMHDAGVQFVRRYGRRR